MMTKLFHTQPKISEIKSQVLKLAPRARDILYENRDTHEERVKTLGREEVRKAIATCDTYLQLVSQVAKTSYQQHWIREANSVLFKKAKLLEKKYQDAFSVFKNESTLPLFVDRDFYTEGWLVLRNPSTIDILKATEFKLKYYACKYTKKHSTTQLFPLPKKFQHTIPCFIGFRAVYNSRDKHYIHSLSYTPTFKKLETIHTQGRFCFGDMKGTASLITKGLQTDNFEKIDQGVTQMTNLLETINLNSPYARGEHIPNVRDIVKWIGKKGGFDLDDEDDDYDDE